MRINNGKKPATREASEAREFTTTWTNERVEIKEILFLLISLVFAKAGAKNDCKGEMCYWQNVRQREWCN